MRHRLVAMVSAVAILALGAGIAYAQQLGDNIYEVDIASATPKGKGSASKPVPAKLGFGYEVSAQGGLRPTAIKQYRIAPEGLVTFPKAFKSCKFSQASKLPEPAAACNKASLGKGTVRNQFGATSDRTSSVACNLRLRLYNISDAGKLGGMAIRLDGGPGEEPAPGCPQLIQETIKAKFFNVKIQGLRSSELRFTVPRNLYEPVVGLSNAVVDVTSVVNKKTAKAKVNGKQRTVGYYSKIGCKGSTRLVRVEFVNLANDKATASKQAAC